MDLKEFTKIAFQFYSGIGETEMKQKDIDQDFEEYWNDKDTQHLVEKLNKPYVIKSLPSEREQVDAWYTKLSINEAEILAQKYKIPRDEYTPWQMGHYEDRLRVYLGEHGKGNVL